MKGTQEQENIWNEIEHGNSHMVIKAGAGVGKTFTIVHGASLLDGENAFLCFNKSIQKELAERLPAGVEAKTFHALGFAAFRNAGIRTKVYFKKTNEIITDILGKDYRSNYPLAKLVGLIKGSMIEANDENAIRGLIDKFNIQFYEDNDETLALEYIEDILSECLKQTHRIDFDDMIWMPLKLDMPMPRFDTLFVDEAQDFNEMQRELIFRCVQDTGRCIVVGDPNQAIYGFRGADSNSMDIFKGQLEQTNRAVTEFPLSLTWRCPKSVVAEANRFVRDFHCMPDAENGRVHVEAHFHPKKDDMVLCRYNAPLVGAFYDLILQGKSAYILGRDMTKNLLNYVGQVTKKGGMSSKEFSELLHTKFKAEYTKLMKADKENQANTLEDKYNCLKIFAARADTVAGIRAEIEKVFAGKEEGDIMLSTVHKAKGLEADNVYILATERMPHPKARNMREELNICYVAITRAKKNLFYVGPRPATQV